MGQFKNELLDRDLESLQDRFDTPLDEEDEQRVEEADVDLNEKYDEDFDTQDL